MSNQEQKWTAGQFSASNYVNYINQVLIDESELKHFKANGAYNSIVGMGIEEQRVPHEHNIKESDLKIDLEFFRKNDFGHKLYDDKITLNTLRYISNLIQVYKFFGNMDNYTITELGIGFGGLGFTFKNIFKNIKYQFIDLDCVVKLTKKYLEKIDDNMNGYIFNQEPIESDLFISEFCLSEFTMDSISYFYNKYCLKAKKVYILSNLDDLQYKSKFIELFNKDFNISIHDEFPKTMHNNYVIFGHKK